MNPCPRVPAHAQDSGSHSACPCWGRISPPPPTLQEGRSRKEILTPKNHPLFFLRHLPGPRKSP